MISLSIIIPTYNEAKNLPLLVEEIFSSIDRETTDLELIVVDDGSPDGTGDVADELATRYPMKVIHRSGKLGLGSAVRAGFAASTRPIIGVMDADLSHDPAILPQLIAALGSSDVAMGSRFESGSTVEAWQRWRKTLSQVGVALARMLTGVRDPLSGYFLMKRSVIDRATLTATGYKILFEILVKGTYETVKEFPFTFRMRRYSSSKLNTKEYVLFLSQIAQYALYRLWFHHRTVVLAGIFGFAAAAYAMAMQSVWLDEALSISFAKESVWRNIGRSMSTDLHPPLYYIFLHASGLVLGQGIWLYRLWSIFAYLATGIILYRYLRQTVRERIVSRIGAVLFFLSPFAVYYAAEARSFMAVMLISLVQYIAWERVVTGRSTRVDRAVYTILSILGSYIFYPVLFLLVVQGVYTLTRGKNIIKKFLWPWAIILAAYTPWLLAVVFERMGDAPGHFLSVPWWQIPAIIFVGFVGGRVAITDINHVHDYWPTLMVGVAGAIHMVGLWLGRKQWKQYPELVRAIVVGGGVVMMCLVISAFRFSIFDPRYYAPLFPLFIIISAGASLFWYTKSKQAWRAVVSMFVVAEVVIIGLSLFNPWYAREPWKGVVPALETEARGGDAVVFIGFDQPPPTYALYEKRDLPVVSAYPTGLADIKDMTAIGEHLRPQIAEYNRLWYSQFLEWQKDPEQQIRRIVEEQFEYKKTIGFFKVQFDLYERK